MLFIEAWQFIVEHPARFFNALGTHVALSASALALAIAVAVPIGVRVARSPHAAAIAIAAANIGRTLPSLAILALAMPLLGTGFTPSWFALTLLALPPILINTHTAIRQVDPEVIDAARGMGMTRGEIVRKVEVPLALPVIFAGIRTAAVQVVSGAVLAAYIGGGGLGDFITAGIAMMALPLLLVGAIPATLLSIGTDQLFGWLQRALTPAGIRLKHPPTLAPLAAPRGLVSRSGRPFPTDRGQIVIEIADLTKQFAGAAHPAIDRLTLTVPEGEVCVLIGPSGCGKTTTMRVVNRMIDPDSGRVTVAGRNIMDVDPVELRRSIGYVIQQIGLFPHWSIADNVATVPRLLGWNDARIAARVDELLALVGMDPATYRDRYPRELSGGQKQRVGVARALAADPPVMLMDEPFGAIDPITRARLQDEFLRILRQLRKTIVFVTHDIDEAIRMGDRIAIMKDGALVQFDTPEAILAAPANEFVESFVGADRALKRLSLIDAQSAMEGLDPTEPAQAVAPQASLKDALAAMLSSGVDALAVVDEHGTRLGVLTLAGIRARTRTTSRDD